MKWLDRGTGNVGESERAVPQPLTGYPKTHENFVLFHLKRAKTPCKAKSPNRPLDRSATEQDSKS